MGGLAKFKADVSKFENDLDVKKMTFRNIVTGEFSKWLNKNDFKQIDIASKMGVSKPAISSLLSGDRNLTLDKIVELADAINCKPYFCLIRCNENYPTPYSSILAFHVEHIEKTSIISENFSYNHEMYSSIKYLNVVKMENN